MKTCDECEWKDEDASGKHCAPCIDAITGMFDEEREKTIDNSSKE